MVVETYHLNTKVPMTSMTLQEAGDARDYSEVRLLRTGRDSATIAGAGCRKVRVKDAVNRCSLKIGGFRSLLSR